MNKELKRKWVKALLRGKYEQGVGYLYAKGRYCCLGVLYEVATGIRPPREWEIRPEFVTAEMEGELAELNDEGIPFDMIAGLIDEAL